MLASIVNNFFNFNTLANKQLFLEKIDFGKYCTTQAIVNKTLFLVSFFLQGEGHLF